jgi:hypothetical protein
MALLEEEKAYLENIDVDSGSTKLPPDLENDLDTFLSGAYQIRLAAGLLFAPTNDSPTNWWISISEAYSEGDYETARFGLGVTTGAPVKVGAFAPRFDAEIKTWDTFPISERARDLLYARLPYQGEAGRLCLVAQVSGVDQTGGAWASDRDEKALRGWVDRWFILDSTDGAIVRRSR